MYYFALCVQGILFGSILFDAGYKINKWQFWAYAVANGALVTYLVYGGG